MEFASMGKARAPELGGGIQDASRSFKVVIAIVEGWHPRHFGLLSEGALRALANILNVIELFGIFPTTQNLLVALIEKDSGGHRLNMCCRALFKVCMGKSEATRLV